jgi:hypothetical protein
MFFGAADERASLGHASECDSGAGFEIEVALRELRPYGHLACRIDTECFLRRPDPDGAAGSVGARPSETDN